MEADYLPNTKFRDLIARLSAKQWQGRIGHVNSQGSCTSKSYKTGPLLGIVGPSQYTNTRVAKKPSSEAAQMSHKNTLTHKNQPTTTRS